jgi:hypothetical protein
MKWGFDFVGPINQHEGIQGTHTYQWPQIMRPNGWRPKPFE